MDDGIYLLIARNVQHKPWFPQDVPVTFEGLRGTDLASTEHPWPLTSYLLALFAAISGFSEICLHLGFLLFPVLLAWAMYNLSSGLTRQPGLATLTLLTLPVVSVLSHTLMTDLPLLALWLAAVALFRRGLLSGSVWPVWTGSILAALACLVTYSGICLIILLVAYALLRRKFYAAFAIVVVPAGVFTVLCATNYVHYHRITPGTLFGSYLFAKRVLSSDLAREKFTFATLALGAVTVSPLFAVFLKGYRVILGALAGALALGLTPQVSHYSPGQKTLLVLYSWAGLYLLIRVIGLTAHSFLSWRKHRESAIEGLFLGVWFIGVYVFCVAAHMTGSARHLLPAMPPLILILFRMIEQKRERLARWMAIANLILCTMLAAALSVADFNFAAIYRDFAETMAHSYPLPTRTTWFTGEWGLRAYLEQAGGQELGRRDARAKPGDLLVVPTLATPFTTLYGERLSLHSMILIAPASISFTIPPIPPGSVVVYTIGMPFHATSDGVQFTVRFVSDNGNHVVLSQEQVSPSAGRLWHIQNVPLPPIAGKGGTIVLEAGVGNGGNANADWLAIARARVALRAGNRETLVYDFQAHMKEAQITAAAGVTYHTDRNLPVFPMDVWLEQEPATVLRSCHQYSLGFPLRLLDSRGHAGFWSSSWGLLPFGVSESQAVLETISVYEVTREVDDYGEEPLSWYEE